MKGLRVTKDVKEINFEETWGELESKKKFPETTHKTFGTNSGFHVKLCTAGKV